MHQHHKDLSTRFLSQIYAPLRNKTLIGGGVTKSELRKLIETHDRVIILGHGTPDGLMAVGQFPDAEFYVVDESFVDSLKNKIENIYIWCNADQFVQRLGLAGLCCGMFISEIEEAICYGYQNLYGGLIVESNDGFASIVSKYIKEPMDILYRNLMDEYEIVAQTDPIARFNLERLYITLAEMNIHPEMMGTLEVS